jgi:hypothetical protein
MSETREVLVITRARFAEIDLNRMSDVRQKALNVLSDVPGLMSMTIWERHDDPFAFMAIGHFSTEDDSLKAWDLLVGSPVMEVISALMSETPSTVRFYVNDHHGTTLEKTKLGNFCSASTRIADLGYGTDLQDELASIFTELRLIGGFLGSITGELTEVSDEILGLAFWASKKAFDASLPAKTLYRIDLYQRVL